MNTKTAAAAIAILVFSLSPSGLVAQTAGGAGGPSAGSGSPAGSPNAVGAGTSGIGGRPSGPASAGGPNNSGNDPTGARNPSGLASPPPGTNSLGTAISSGPGAGVTTGSARTREDDAIDAETKTLDRKIKSICRGC